MTLAFTKGWFHYAFVFRSMKVPTVLNAEPWMYLTMVVTQLSSWLSCIWEIINPSFQRLTWRDRIYDAIRGRGSLPTGQ